MKSWIAVDKSHTWVYVVLKCTYNDRYAKKTSSAKVLFRVCRDKNEYHFELVNVMSGYFNSIGFSLPVSGLCPFNPTVLRFYDETFEIIEYFDTFEDVCSKYPEYMI